MEKSNRKDRLSFWNITDQEFVNLQVESFIDDVNGIRLCLRDDHNKLIRISFENVLSYRNTDESFLLLLWHTTPKEILGRYFYLIYNSSYVDFFHEMTLSLYKEWNIQHYAIYTTNDCIDVLSMSTPQIEFNEF